LVKSNSDNVIATAMFSTRLEPTYKVIDGKWMSSNSDRYGVIHRMAIAKKNRRSGVSKFIFKTFEMVLKKNKIKSMRIDTHVDNTGMQNLLLKLNYNYCGIIYLENGDLRLAYEKLI
jgi:beta-glucosidase/6-phospho-beta-glucosidase/beta-galactosidase